MSNPHYGGQFGQPGNTGQFQGQIPQSSQQFQGQMPQQTGFNGQMPGQMPQAPRKKNNKATALIAVPPGTTRIRGVAMVSLPSSTVNADITSIRACVRAGGEPLRGNDHV